MKSNDIFISLYEFLFISKYVIKYLPLSYGKIQVYYDVTCML